MVRDNTTIAKQPDMEAKIEEAKIRARRMCESDWSKDGTLHLNGMMSLRGGIEVRGVTNTFKDMEDMFRERHGDDGRIEKSEAEERAEFLVYMQYLKKGVKEYSKTDQKKEAHVRFLLKCCMECEWEFALEKCKEALVDYYNEGGVWGKYIPKVFEANIAKHDAKEEPDERDADPVIVCTDIFKRINIDATHIYKKYQRRNSTICAEFAMYMIDKDRNYAKRIVSIGLELFPDNDEIIAAASKVFDSKDENMLKVWCIKHVANPDSEYYQMAKASPHWSVHWALRLADMLGAKKEFEAESRVLKDAGLESRVEEKDIFTNV